MKKVQITLITLLAVAAAITVGCGDSHNPTFSKLPFSSYRGAEPSTGLYLMNLDGSSVTPVPYSVSGFYSPSISADYKTIAYTSNSEVWASNSDGTSQTQLTTNNDSGFYSYFAKISPNGKKIVFGIWDGVSSYHFWIMNADGTSKQDLTPTLPTGMTSCASGSFSADSKQIAFTCWGDSTYGVYLIHPDGTHLTTVLTQSSFVDTPMFSPDGKKILFVSFGANPAVRKPTFFNRTHPATHSTVHGYGISNFQGIVSVNPDGSNLTVVVPNCFEAEILNSSLYYTLYSSDLGFDQIYKANLDGTSSVSVSDGTADDWLALSSD